MWKTHNTVIYHIPPNFKYHPSVAIFNFHGTLVENVSPYESNPQLIFKFSNTKDKFLELHAKGASIIIYQTELPTTKSMLESFIQLIPIPVAIFIPTKKNKYAKPFTGIWYLIQLLYTKHKITINKTTSLVIGHLAGRVTTDHTFIDSSCADKAFASNIEVSFTTPERFFSSDESLMLWKWSGQIISIPNRKKLLSESARLTQPTILHEFNSLPDAPSHTIIVTGPPCSGKTYQAKKFLNLIKSHHDRKFDCISENATPLDDMPELLSAHLSDRKTVFIDMSDSPIHIIRCIKKSMEQSSPILLIELTAPVALTKLFSFIRVQTSTDHSTELLPPNWEKHTPINVENIYRDIPCVRSITYPITIHNSEAYWMQYCY